jgi:glucose/arabinose dehydrogenase
MRAIIAALSVASLLLAGCGDSAKLPEQASTGSNPPLPEPNKTLIPTVNIATAKGWPQGGKPTAASGLAVAAFAGGLDHALALRVAERRRAGG